MRAIATLMLAWCAGAGSGLEVAIEVPASGLHIDGLLAAVEVAQVPPGGRLIVTAWFHPTDQVVGIYELPRKDLDARTAGARRLIFRNAGSRRVGNTFTTTATWLREADEEVVYHRIETAGEVHYLRRTAVGYETCVELLTRLRSGDYQAWEVTTALGGTACWDDVTGIEQDPTGAAGVPSYRVFRLGGSYAIFTFTCGELCETGCGVVRS